MTVDPTIQTTLPVTRRFLPEDFFFKDIDDLMVKLKENPVLLGKFPFLIELAETEHLKVSLRHTSHPDREIDNYRIRSGVELVELSWSGFDKLFDGKDINPVKKQSLLLLIPHESDGSVALIVPDNHSLLALKIVAEGLDLFELAKKSGTSVNHLQNVLALAVSKGILQEPVSKIRRSVNFSAENTGFENFLSTNVFTLQWHITQSCDLNCKHCYDRSSMQEVSLDEGREILDQLYRFCNEKNVRGQVTFTGGNPLLHPNFLDMYRMASDRGFMTAILGNPASGKQLQQIIDIQMLEFFQVSLEGLETHNDYIRGAGHYKRIMKFLELLKEMEIYSMVMLTLTRANQEQVLPLAEILRDKAELFTFNRLAMVGEGAALVSAEQEGYGDFLRSYRKAAETNPIMRLKDNFFNIIHLQKGYELVGGCTGHGCGAAFNFVSLLSDGQVYACRKFPSPIGNIKEKSLSEIYEGRDAEKYRAGATLCYNCKIRPVCGGCLAVTHGFGEDCTSCLDPYCFIGE